MKPRLEKKEIPLLVQVSMRRKIFTQVEEGRQLGLGVPQASKASSHFSMRWLCRKCSLEPSMFFLHSGNSILNLLFPVFTHLQAALPYRAQIKVDNLRIETNGIEIPSRCPLQYYVIPTAQS